MRQNAALCGNGLNELELFSFFYPFPNNNISDWFKLKEFADDNFKFNVNVRKFLKCVGNTVGKGEIAHYKQFLLFPHCFQKTCSADTLKKGFVWERIEYSIYRWIILHCGSVCCFMNLIHD